MGTESASPRAGRRFRGRELVIALVAGCALLYLVVVALYAVNAGTTTIVGCTDDEVDDSILLSLTPSAVDAVGDRIPAILSVVDFGPAAGPYRLPDEDLTLIVTGTDGAQSYAYDAGALAAAIPLRFVTDGEIERWPFDTHTAQFAVVVLQESGGTTEPIPATLCGNAHVPGWAFSSDEVAGTGIVEVNGQRPDEIRFTAQRSAATVAFGIVILLLMTVMPVLGLIVAIRVLRGERKAEATLMSWMAAMLFATIPLRGFLPGSPPIGSWVDYLIVLWVVAALVAALVIYVIAWLKWAPSAERPAR